MPRILCSTGAIIALANHRDYTLLPVIMPHLRCDGLEFMMYQSWHDQHGGLRRVLAAYDVPVFHMTKQIGQWISEGNLPEALDMFRKDCALARDMGAKLLVLHLWSGRASDQRIQRNIAAYPVLRDVAEGFGLTLTIENVLCNTRDPMTHMRTLAEAHPDIAFTFDTKMAAFHSQLEGLYAPENAWLRQRIVHYHVNDYAGGHMEWANMSARPLGKGHVNLDQFFDFVRESGYKGDFTYEASALNPDGAVRFEEINRNLDRIRKGGIL